MSEHEISEGFLLPDEKVLIAKSREARKRSFAAGRVAARRALEKMTGCKDVPILSGQSREPQWPEGIIGSISHTDGMAVAAVARAPEIRLLGIDIEQSSHIIDDGMVGLIASEQEAVWIRKDKEDQNQRALLLFSAKESVYKGFFPPSQTHLDFHDVELRWNPERAAFIGRLLREVMLEYPLGFEFQVVAHVVGPYVVTGFWL
ncbi:MAG: 4'-phosphopantetheinyl transferase family protein [Terriglobia bacterium]